MESAENFQVSVSRSTNRLSEPIYIDFITINLYVIIIMELLTTREFILTHPHGSGREDEIVSGDIRYIDNGRPKPLMIIAHGYKTFKDWGMFPYVGEYFAEHGYVTIVINFARNGVKTGEKQISDWELFSRLTATSEIEDLHLVLDAVDEGALEYYGIDTEQTGRIMLGHSGGGSVSVITAAEREDIDAVVLWSAPSTFDRFKPEEIIFWREKGELELHGDPEYGTIRVGIEPLDDIENNAGRLNIIAAIKRLTCPVFIAQGDGDPTVSRDEADELYAAAGSEKCKLLELQGSDHLYGVKHPYEPGSSGHLDLLLDETNRWLDTVLNNT